MVVKAFTNEEVKQIREEYAQNPEFYWVLSERYGVSESTISKMLRNKTYQSAGGPTIDISPHSSKNFSCKQVIEIRKMAKKTPLVEIAEEKGISYHSVLSIVTGKSYKECGGEIIPEIRSVTKPRKASLSDEEVVRYRQEYWYENVSGMDICKRIPISVTSTYRMLNGTSYSWVPMPFTEEWEKIS